MQTSLQTKQIYMEATMEKFHKYPSERTAHIIENLTGETVDWTDKDYGEEPNHIEYPKFESVNEEPF